MSKILKLLEISQGNLLFNEDYKQQLIQRLSQDGDINSLNIIYEKNREYMRANPYITITDVCSICLLHIVQSVYPQDQAQDVLTKLIITTPKLTNKQTATFSGHTTYMGEPCPKGHIGERYTKQGKCCTCERLNSKHFREQN